jgi:hypothetical protein
MRTLKVITHRKGDNHIARSIGYKGQTTSTNSAEVAAIRHAAKILDEAEDDLKAAEDPTVAGQFLVTIINPLIDEITAMIERGERPGGLVAAIIQNDLRSVIAHREFTFWKQIEDAVCHIYTHVPTYKVDVWKKKLKGGR